MLWWGSCPETNLGSRWTPPSHLGSVFSSHSGHSACWEHAREPKHWMRLMDPSHTFGVPEVAPTARLGRSGSALPFGMNPCGIGSQSSSRGLCRPCQRSQGASED